MAMNDEEQFSVVDFKNDSVKTFIADKYYTADGEMFDRALETNVSVAGQTALNDYLNAISKLKQRNYSIPLDFSYTATVENITDATMLITHQQTQGLIENYLSHHASTLAVDAEVVANSITNFLGISNIPVVLTVSFENGSSAQFLGSIISENGVLEIIYSYVEGSATFPGGGKIPNDPSRLLGVYQFADESSITGFSRLGALWGATISETEYCADQYEVECKRTGEGRYECTATPKCK